MRCHVFSLFFILLLSCICCKLSTTTTLIRTAPGLGLSYSLTVYRPCALCSRARPRSKSTHCLRLAVPEIHFNAVDDRLVTVACLTADSLNTKSQFSSHSLQKCTAEMIYLVYESNGDSRCSGHITQNTEHFIWYLVFNYLGFKATLV